MAGKIVKVNRAPVLTLWAAVVAEHVGFDRDEALTLGRGLAGLDAQSKGRALGIFQEHPEEERKPRPQRTPGEEFAVDLVGRQVPAVVTEQGAVRAVSKGQPVDPASVERYLEKKFGAELPEVRAAMEELAESLPPEELAARAYSLYERFRPVIPGGKRGWGALGDLDLDKVRAMAKG